MAEAGRVVGLPPGGVELDAGDEDLAQVEAIGQDPGRHEPAARDRQHEVVVAPDLLRELPDEAVELLPRDVDRLGRDHQGSQAARERDGTGALVRWPIVVDPQHARSARLPRVRAPACGGVRTSSCSGVVVPGHPKRRDSTGQERPPAVHDRRAPPPTLGAGRPRTGRGSRRWIRREGRMVRPRRKSVKRPPVAPSRHAPGGAGAESPARSRGPPPGTQPRRGTRPAIEPYAPGRLHGKWRGCRGPRPLGSATAMRRRPAGRSPLDGLIRGSHRDRRREAPTCGLAEVDEASPDPALTPVRAPGGGPSGWGAVGLLGAVLMGFVGIALVGQSSGAPEPWVAGGQPTATLTAPPTATPHWTAARSPPHGTPPPRVAVAVGPVHACPPGSCPTRLGRPTTPGRPRALPPQWPSTAARQGSCSSLPGPRRPPGWNSEHVVDGDGHVGLSAAANGGAGAPTEGAIPGRIRLTRSTQETLLREAHFPDCGGGSVR